MRRIGAWCLAGISIPFSGLLSVGLLAGSAVLIRDYAMTRICEAVAERRFTDALEYQLTTKRLDEIIRSIPHLGITALNHQRTRELLELGAVAVRRDRRELLARGAGFEEDPAIHDGVQTLVTALDRDLARRRSGQTSPETLEALEHEYRELRDSLSRVLNLPISLGMHPFEFYESGILEGMPVLPTLQTSPSTLTELREQIESAGGKIMFLGRVEDPKARLMLELAPINDRAAVLRERLVMLGLGYRSEKGSASKGETDIETAENGLISAIFDEVKKSGAGPLFY